MTRSRYRSSLSRVSARRRLQVIAAALLAAVILAAGFYLGQLGAYSGMGIDPELYRQLRAEQPKLQEQIQVLETELEKIEKPAGIANPKDFRNEVVNFVLRARANNNGRNPSWMSYQKLRDVIEKKMFSNTEELLPVISFNPKGSEDDRRKHDNFVKRMMDRGYTEKQVRLLSEWYLRVRKAQ